MRYVEAVSEYHLEMVANIGWHTAVLQGWDTKKREFPRSPWDYVLFLKGKPRRQDPVELFSQIAHTLKATPKDR